MATIQKTYTIGKDATEVFDFAFDIVDAILTKDREAMGKLVTKAFSAFDGYENILPELAEYYPELTGHVSTRVLQIVKKAVDAKKVKAEEMKADA